MREAGLTIREDAMGNIFGRLQGSDPLAGKDLQVSGKIATLYATEGNLMWSRLMS